MAINRRIIAIQMLPKAYDEIQRLNFTSCRFYIRGPEPKGWHLGQKQVPRFCTRTRSMVLPQIGQGSPPL